MSMARVVDAAASRRRFFRPLPQGPTLGPSRSAHPEGALAHLSRSPTMTLSRWAALLLLAAPLTAQIDDKAAVAQFKSATKTLLKDFKSASNDEKSALLDAIDAFEDELAAAVDPFAAGQSLADALQAYHSGIRTLVIEATIGGDAAWQQALSDFAGGAPLNGVLPEGLVSGDGGAVDDFRVDVDKQLDKLASTINKRLDKAEKAAEKDGFGLLAWSGSPPGLAASDANEAVAVSTFPPLAISVMLSLSDLAVANDGHVWVGGTSNGEKLPVSVTLSQGLATLDSANTPIFSQQTWMIGFDGEGGGVAEGNVTLIVDVDDTGAMVAESFGIL
jgi:hypothetical protein